MKARDSDQRLQQAKSNIMGKHTETSLDGWNRKGAAFGLGASDKKLEEVMEKDTDKDAETSDIETEIQGTSEEEDEFADGRQNNFHFAYENLQTSNL